jgi:ParB-like chromosome segregation protein Spo0J
MAIIKEIDLNLLNPCCPIVPKDASYQILKRNIEKNGIKKPIKIFKNYIVRDGYHRIAIARELGFKTVPCIIIE